MIFDQDTAILADIAHVLRHYVNRTHENLFGHITMIWKHYIYVHKLWRCVILLLYVELYASCNIPNIYIIIL